MSTQPTTEPNTWVDPHDLICPGCTDTVVCQPPANQPAGVIRPVLEFHRDGSPLCWTDTGHLQPIEREVRA